MLSAGLPSAGLEKSNTIGLTAAADVGVEEKLNASGVADDDAPGVTETTSLAAGVVVVVVVAAATSNGFTVPKENVGFAPDDVAAAESVGGVAPKEKPTEAGLVGGAPKENTGAEAAEAAIGAS